MFYMLTKKDVSMIFSAGSAGMITAIVMTGAGLARAGELGWQLRAEQMVLSVADAVCELRDKELLVLSADVFQKHLQLKVIYELSKNEQVQESVRDRLMSYLELLPKTSKPIEEAIKGAIMNEQHGYLVMQAGAALQHFMRIEQQG